MARTKIADAYRELADLLLSQGRILEAQRVLELLKAEEVKDFTRSEKKENTTEVAQTPQEAEVQPPTSPIPTNGHHLF